MNDLLGKALAVGDVVAVPRGKGRKGSLALGTVLKLCKVLVVVEYAYFGKYSKHSIRAIADYYPSDVVKV